jgi:hypothetical protein
MAYNLDITSEFTVKSVNEPVGVNSDSASNIVIGQFLVQYLTIPEDDLAVAIPFGAITEVNHLIIVSDQVITVHLNGDLVGLTVETLALHGAEITSITLDGHATADATVKILMAED